MRFRPLGLLGLVLISSASAVGYNQNAPILPNRAISPGDVLTTDTRLICQPGYTKTVRNVPQALKNQVYKEYGILSREPGEYEVDHIISLELGGSNSIRNLYPESYKTEPLNAHVKDVLENRLHDLACSGKITIQEAQQAISTDWTVAYSKYVGPLPGGPLQGVKPGVTPAVSAVPVLPPAQTTGGATAGVQPLADGSCPSSAPIKISKAGLYHLPQGDSSYNRTHATQCFADAQSAAAAGFRGVK